MYGILRIEIGVHYESRGRLITVLRENCTMEKALEIATRFKTQNHELEPVIAQVTWQAEREYL